MNEGTITNIAKHVVYPITKPVVKHVAYPLAKAPGAVTYQAGKLALQNKYIASAAGIGLLTRAAREIIKRKKEQEQKKYNLEDLDTKKFRNISEETGNDNLPLIPIVPNISTPPIKKSRSVSSILDRAKSTFTKRIPRETFIKDQQIHTRQTVKKGKAQTGYPSGFGKLMR
jgi:hypothetical protein